MLCPGVTVDDDVIQIGGRICSVQTQYTEALEGGGASEHAEGQIGTKHTEGEGEFFSPLTLQTKESASSLP